MLTIKLGDQDLAIKENTTLTELLQQIEITPQIFAIAINQLFIGKSEYDKTILRAGDKVAIITPMQGG